MFPYVFETKYPMFGKFSGDIRSNWNFTCDWALS